MTLDERVEALERSNEDMRQTLDRHSKKLTELFSLKETITILTDRMGKVEDSMKAMQNHQKLTDRKMLGYQKATIVLISVAIGLFFYIASQNSSVAKDIAVIVASAGVKAV